MRPPYVLSYVLVSIGPYFGWLNFSGLDVYDVPSGDTPRFSAAMRPMILKVEPGWRLPCAARLNFVSAYFADDAIARMWPLRGSIVTIAALGAFPKLRT